MDNTDASFEGEWFVGTVSEGKYGQDYKYAFAVSTEPTAAAIYRPDIKTAGKYHVEIFFPTRVTRSSDAPWTITYKGGSTTVRVDQTKSGGQWFRIGNGLEFETGTNGFVKLSNKAADAGPKVNGKSHVVTDAVRFVPVGVVPDGVPETVKQKPATKPATIEPKPATPGKLGPRGDFALKIKIDGGGIIVKEPQQESYTNNTRVTLTAKPLEGFVFGGWTGDWSTIRNPLVIHVTSTTDLEAHFWEAGIGVIMDDQEAQFVGNWAKSAQAWPGARNDGHHFTGATAGSATARGIYRPNLPRTGVYDIYIWYVSGENRTSSAPWTVYHKGGAVTTKVNQQIQGAQWVPIAANVEFAAGETGYVEVSNSSDVTGGAVIADAVAFVYVGVR